MTVKTALCTAVSLLWLVTATGQAAGPFSLGGRGVEYTPRDGDSDWGGGAQARLRLPLFFGADASVDYRHSRLGDTKVHDWPVQLSALVYVLPTIIVVQPFLLAGGGWYHSTVEGPNGFSDTRTRFGPHAGAGLELNLYEHWFLDATYRYIWLDDIRTVNAAGTSVDLRDHGHQVTFGLNYRF